MTKNAPSKNGMRQARIIVAAVIVFAFAAIVALKVGSGAPASPADAETTGSPSASGKISESHADANAAYDAALAGGKPVYVLFHSLTCDPCIEISAIVDKIIPAYEGKVVFVNAISDDPGSQVLGEKFQFQYIPQSFFIDAKGSVVDSFTGAMDEPAMKAYLDKLSAP
jgi:putative thioredoxin